MHGLKIIFYIISIFVAIHTAYLFVVAMFGFKKSKKIPASNNKGRFCILIPARNEESVIANLIKSLKNQNYPTDKLDLYVLLNNCTDDTEKIASECGAFVYKCKTTIKCKGDALSEFFNTDLASGYDAFCIFDADNVVDANFIKKMNDALQNNVPMAQGYRDGKNPKDSWLASSYTIYFWLINRFLNNAHQNLSLSAYITGTGCMISADVIKEMGFKTTTLTEDFEYSIMNILTGKKIKLINDAVFYDEHPNNFSTSLVQRKRWATGTNQLVAKYGKTLIKNTFKNKSFISFDTLIYSLAPFSQFLTVICFILFCIISILSGSFLNVIFSLLFTIIGSILFCLIIAIFAPMLEHKKLSDLNSKTIFTLWIFLLSYTLVNFVSIICPTKEWKAIKHNKNSL